MSTFGLYSKYYDFLYQDKNYQLEAEYLQNIFSKYGKSPIKSIFEMGCGTGKLAHYLVSKGFTVHGIDSSQTMVDRAQAEFGRLSQFKCEIGDVCEYRKDVRFDAVVSIFHVMSYQNSNENLLSALKTANVHLQPGGLFVFDFWYGPAVLTEKPEKRKKVFENAKMFIERHASPDLHINQNRVDVNYEILVCDKKTDEKEVLKETHKMRYFFLPEMEFFLNSAGFKILKTASWLTDEEPTEKSWGVAIVAQKTAEVEHG